MTDKTEEGEERPVDKGYMAYVLKTIADQGAIASIYADPKLPDEFTVGKVEAVDSQYFLICEFTAWGQIDGWRVRRNQDVTQVLYGEEYEERLAMLLAYHHVVCQPFFSEMPDEQTDLLLSVLLKCRENQELVSIAIGEDIITGRVVEANGLRMKLRALDFFGRDAGEETITLRDIEMLEFRTPEEQMYLELEEMENKRLRLLEANEIEDHDPHDIP